ncbi:hypothetical protein F5144DRAFT_557223 [Chaetomium tenue]|uniref:Uncharacterized protein n=1 Tax=Chaetomium tenue TaxID=1854479 RepID=A0ACB7PPI1_9PEZI|nr:hypothetical protein F5144DRAFT_557223 [Chaetomium globosum]
MGWNSVSTYPVLSPRLFSFFLLLFPLLHTRFKQLPDYLGSTHNNANPQPKRTSSCLRLVTPSHPISISNIPITLWRSKQ